MPEQKTNLSVYNLIIELTRRCNMKCEHCLRGNARNQDIDLKFIDRALELFDRIDEITFTGGEPTLNLTAMRYFFDKAKELGKEIGAFYVVTNGAENQPELAHILLDAYAGCTEKDLCGVALSLDQFHQYWTEQSEYVKGLVFYKQDKEYESSGNPMWVINRGRAEYNGMGREPYTHMGFSVEKTTYQKSNEIEIAIETLYLATDGWLYPDANLSYEIMDENQKLNITQPNITEYFENLDPNEDEEFLEI